jgi:hypothetical protein
MTISNEVLGLISLPKAEAIADLARSSIRCWMGDKAAPGFLIFAALFQDKNRFGFGGPRLDFKETQIMPTYGGGWKPGQLQLPRRHRTGGEY